MRIKNILTSFVILGLLWDHNSLGRLSAFRLLGWSRLLLRGFKTRGVVQVWHVHSLGVVLVLLEVSLSRHVLLLLLKVIDHALGVTVVEELDLTAFGRLLDTLFCLLVAVVSCVRATIVSHYARFLRNVTSIMLLLLLIFRILDFIILLLLIFNDGDLLLSLPREVRVIFLIQINISIAYLTWQLRSLMANGWVLIMILQNTLWWSLIRHTFTSLVDHLLNVVGYQWAFELVLV